MQGRECPKQQKQTGILKGRKQMKATQEEGASYGHITCWGSSSKVSINKSHPAPEDAGTTEEQQPAQ